MKAGNFLSISEGRSFKDLHNMGELHLVDEIIFELQRGQ